MIGKDRLLTTGTPLITESVSSMQLVADSDTGMVMTLSLIADSARIQVAVGFESGHTMVFVQTDPGASFERLYCAQPHTQPGSFCFVIT